jgi:hypothetical protein
MAKDNCSICGFSGTEKDYLEHTCSTGFNPTQVEHQDALTHGVFSKQAEKALERGSNRQK